jgi:predicted nucleic acid-binding protein
VIVFDTCALSSLMATKPDARTERIERLLVEKPKEELWLSAAVVFEVCASKSTEEAAKEARRFLLSHFRILPFDARVAGKAGELFAKAGGFKRDTVLELKAPSETRNVTQQRLKFDALIVAAAVVHEADYLLTWDPGLLALAKKLDVTGVKIGEHVLSTLKAVQLEIEDVDEPATPAPKTRSKK